MLKPSLSGTNSARLDHNQVSSRRRRRRITSFGVAALVFAMALSGWSAAAMTWRLPFLATEDIAPIVALSAVGRQPAPGPDPSRAHAPSRTPAGGQSALARHAGSSGIEPPGADLSQSDDVGDEAIGDALTLLLLGVDARPGEAIDGGVRADAIVVMRVDAAANTCRLLSIPRDARVEVPGAGATKINHALAIGGVSLQSTVVAGLLGVPLDRYALVDFEAFATVIDAAGGVSVDVAAPFSLDDISFAAGPQRLDGASALAYVRYRGDATGDLGRIGRQQQVMRAVADQLNPWLISRLATLVPVLSTNFRTDLSLPEMTGLTLRYLDPCRPDNIEVATLAGEPDTFVNPVTGQAGDFIVLDAADIQANVDALFAPAD